MTGNIWPVTKSASGENTRHSAPAFVERVTLARDIFDGFNAHTAGSIEGNNRRVALSEGRSIPYERLLPDRLSPRSKIRYD